MLASNGAVLVVSSQTQRLMQFVGDRHEFYVAQIIDIDTPGAVTLFTGMEDFYNIITGTVYRIKVDGKYRVAAASPHLVDEQTNNVCSFPVDEHGPSRLMLQ